MKRSLIAAAVAMAYPTPKPAEPPKGGPCLRCVTPKKCAIHGCCPGTWPAEDPVWIGIDFSHRGDHYVEIRRYFDGVWGQLCQESYKHLRPGQALEIDRGSFLRRLAVALDPALKRLER